MTHDKIRLIASFASAFALALCLALSVVMRRGNDPGVRRVFVFEHIEAPVGLQFKTSSLRRVEVKSIGKTRLALETRFLPHDSTQGDVAAYADDLVLGPITHGLLPLFAPGTRVAACFVRGGVLYLDLNNALLNVNGRTSSIETGISLLKKNILLNFPDIHDVLVFVDGVEAYSS